jgi:hypothetical protein
MSPFSGGSSEGMGEMTNVEWLEAWRGLFE